MGCLVGPPNQASHKPSAACWSNGRRDAATWNFDEQFSEVCGKLYQTCVDIDWCVQIAITCHVCKLRVISIFENSSQNPNAFFGDALSAQNDHQNPFTTENPAVGIGVSRTAHQMYKVNVIMALTIFFCKTDCNS